MIDRLFGIIVGGIVAFLLLLLFDDGRIISDQTTGFAVAVGIGAAAILISRRAKGRRNELVQAEVQRQLSTQVQQPPESEP